MDHCNLASYLILTHLQIFIKQAQSALGLELVVLLPAGKHRFRAHLHAVARHQVFHPSKEDRKAIVRACISHWFL